MRISEKAIERPRLVFLASALACLLGFAAVYTLPKERTPRVKLPVIVVAVPNFGASPHTNESQIIRRIEDESGDLTGLRDDGGIISEAVSGAAIVQFIFDDDVDVSEAKRDVESLINRIKGEFPEDAQTDPGPMVQDIAFEDFPIIQVFIAGGSWGGGGGEHRRLIAEELQRQIERIDGVSGVDIFGGLEREVLIEVDPHRMALYGFSYDQVAGAIVASNTEAPTGEISGDSGEESRVRVRSKLADIESIRTLPVGQRSGKPIRLGDLAEVSLGYKDPVSMARYGGEDAVVVLARAKTDVDVLKAADRIQTLVDEFIESGSHDGTEIGTVRSQAREIRYMINQLGMSAVYGTVLVVLFLWLAMGWRNATLISISLPFALLVTGGLMWAAKRTVYPDIAINNMTLFAMILVVGMVVDGCIIVGENIYRHRELGRSPLSAAKRGIHEVSASLMCAYLTTFAAFAPMFLIRGIMGDFMSLMPITVIFALCAAMLVDHFLLPVMSMYLMKVPPEKSAVGELNACGVEDDEIENALAVVKRSSIHRVYGRMIGYALHHRLLVLILAMTISITPVILFLVGAIRFEFFPEGDVPIIEVNFELPLGSSMSGRTSEIAGIIEQAVEDAVREEEWFHPSDRAERVRPVTTMGEPGALNINLEQQEGMGPEFGMVYVELELAENRERSVFEIRRAIKRAIPPLPGVQVHVTVPEDGPPAGSPVAVRVLGHTDTTLADLADYAVIVRDMLKQSVGTYDVTMDYRLRPEIVVDPDRVTAGMFDVDAAQIARSVNFALEGARLGDVDLGGDEEIELRLRNLRTNRDELEDLQNLPIRTASGRIVSLEQVSRIERQYNANVIRHYDQRRVINVRSELAEGVIPDDIKADLIEKLRPDLSGMERKRLLLDRDNRTIYSDDKVIIEFGGENQIRDDALVDLNMALLVAAASMLIILMVQFNSFIQPLIILFSVPLSFVGVSIGLMLCGFYFSISAMIGIVALSGIVVNDAIVLMDFINRMKSSGVSTEQAVTLAGQLRLRPIFLTTVTTIGGLIPLGLNLAGGGEFWQPLTTTIMFGLGFATLLQLFIIPLAYYTFDRTGRVSFLDPAGNPALAGENHAGSESESVVGTQREAGGDYQVNLFGEDASDRG